MRLIENVCAGCCIYEKPKKFGESSSDDSDDECENCLGHKDNHKTAFPKTTEPPEKPVPSIVVKYCFLMIFNF